MNGAKGGKASVRSPEHFPIEKARAVHKARAAVYRKQREDEGEAGLLCVSCFCLWIERGNRQ